MKRIIAVFSFFAILCLCAFAVVLFFGPKYLYQNYRTYRLISHANENKSTEVDLGLIPWVGTLTKDPGEIAAVRRLSKELHKQGDGTHITLKWQHTGNPDDMEAIVEYYPSVQMLIYNPEVLGWTYRYEGVAPEHIHSLAKRQSSRFADLKKLGCSAAEYDND
jgi:hypothetical protein